MLRALTTILLACGATAATAQAIQPGQWRSSSRIVSMAMPGMPPDAFKAMEGKTTTVDVCVTPADVAAGSKRLFGATDGKCDYDSYRVGGGTIATTARCTGGPGGPMTMTATGNYTPTTYAIRSEMKSPKMTMTMAATARRTGPCVK